MLKYISSQHSKLFYIKLKISLFYFQFLSLIRIYIYIYLLNTCISIVLGTGRYNSQTDKNLCPVRAYLLTGGKQTINRRAQVSRCQVLRRKRSRLRGVQKCVFEEWGWGGRCLFKRNPCCRVSSVQKSEGGRKQAWGFLRGKVPGEQPVHKP